MAVARARKVAFQILLRVETEGAYASDLLYTELNASRQIKPEDAALATELTMGVLRWQRLLDALLQRQLKKPAAKLDLPVLLALRLGLYQLRFLQRVPARAAVHESVELVKTARKHFAAPLVNAVLRCSASEAVLPVDKLLPLETSMTECLAIQLSHPTWMVERWLARFGESKTRALLEANNRAPQMSCSLHDPASASAVMGELQESGLHVAPGRLLKSAFSVAGGRVAHTSAFREGRISIQDEASQLVPLLLDAQPGNRVLDLCAAPGGKTPPLARAIGPSGFLVAADRHEHRLHAMKAQFQRTKLPGIHAVALDATVPLPFRLPFQRILVDAPCSGTGTLARHPEIRWKLDPQKIAELSRLQTKILASALAQLAPGGRIVYSTCSLEPEENEQVVAEVLRRTPSVRQVPASVAASSLASHLVAGLNPADFFGRDGYFRTLPGEQPADGFFAAILEKS